MTTTIRGQGSTNPKKSIARFGGSPQVLIMTHESNAKQVRKAPNILFNLVANMLVWAG